MTPAHPVPEPTSPAPSSPAASSTAASSTAPSSHRRLRRGLWIALAVGLVANLITVITVDDPLYSSGIGGFVLLCAAALGVLALRRGPRSGGAA